MQEELLTAGQVATILGLDVNTVSQYLREGRIQGAKTGRIWRVRRSDLQLFVDRKRRDREAFRNSSVFWREQLDQMYAL